MRARFEGGSEREAERRDARRLSFARASSLASALLGVLVALGTTGCGNALYVMSIDDAEGQLEQAQALEAERYASYEFYSASARLDEAKRQAAQAEYGYAMQLADEAADFARKAREKAQTARAQANTKAGAEAASTDAAAPRPFAEP